VFITRYAFLLSGESLYLGLSDGGVTDFFGYLNLWISFVHMFRDKTRTHDFDFFIDYNNTRRKE